MTGRRWISYGALAGGLLLGATALPGATLAPKAYGLEVEGRDLVIPYQSSHDLEGRHPGIRRVVVAVHSASYNAQEAYNAVVITAAGPGGDGEETGIIAPQFLRSSELPGSIPENLLYWNNFPFRGTSSARFGPAAGRVAISALDVLDRLLERVSDGELFPDLETVVVAGFSAGGQLVNRYAAAGRFEESLVPARGIHVRYLVLAPSSYVYFTPERDPDGDGVFEVPDTCGGYNDWGYGLEDLWSYPAETGEAGILTQYPDRFVFYLVGAEDNDPNDTSLATDCESSLQGTQRLARATSYFTHLERTFGAEIRKRQRLEIVPGVGHSYSGVLNSAAGRRYLLDRDTADTDGDKLTDWAEWIAGTDPGDEADTFALRWDLNAAPGQYGLRWPAQPGRRYQILTSPSPAGPFTEAGIVDVGKGEEDILWPAASGTAPEFFRVDLKLN